MRYEFQVMSYEFQVMRVALIHDHLAQMGGAEKVLQVLVEMFPNAPIYTLLYDEENIKKNFQNVKIEPSIIQKMPGGIRHYKWYMPFMPMAVEFFDLTGYDVVLSSTSSFAKGVITTPDTLHICYCHTPTRYVWSDTHQYINELKYNKWFKKAISLVLNYIRIWDRQAADRVDKFIANSKTVQKRIRKYYKTDSTIIHPNIEEEKFYISNEIKDYFLVGCRLVPYKRIDIVIQAFKKLGLDLKIFGDGPDMERLKEIAAGAKNIQFLGRVSDQDRSQLFAECRAYINPQTEDFGLTIVEALASGRPVIAMGRGGATETVDAGKSGIFMNAETAAEVERAVLEFQKHGVAWTPQEIRNRALEFSKESFKRKMMAFIEGEYKKFKNE